MFSTLFAAAIFLFRILGGVLLLTVLTVLLLQFHRMRQAPSGIPWSGVAGRRWFPKLQASFLAFTHEKQFLAEGYEKARLDAGLNVIADI